MSQETRRAVLEILCWVFAAFAISGIILACCGCAQIGQAVGVSAPQKYAPQDDWTYRIRYFSNWYYLNQPEEFKAYVMNYLKHIHAENYLFVIPCYAERLNCPGYPGYCKRLEGIAVYYAKEK